MAKKKSRVKRFGRRVKRAASRVPHKGIIPTLFFSIGLGRLVASPPAAIGGMGSQSVIQVAMDKSQDLGSKAVNALEALGENLYSPAVYGPIVAGIGAAVLAKWMKLRSPTKIDRKWSIL